MEQYDSDRNLYLALINKTKSLITDLLQKNNIQFHSIDVRIKPQVSLQAKIIRPGSRYNDLSDITDIAGIRIITYFSDDVDKIGEIISSEFNIDSEKSIDKRQILDPDRFGYLSLHYVVSHLRKRASLPEYEDIADLFLEIQIRSILQHAWAEIEHDLGYKSTIEIPNRIQRRFSRVAGLLELADDEFVGLRNGIRDYADSVALEMDESPKSIQLDATSLSIFVESNPTVDKLDKELAELFHATKLEAYEASIELQMLQHAGIKTIEELNEALDNNINSVPKFCELWISGSVSDTISKGLSLFYLGYILVAQLDNVEKEKSALKGLFYKEGADAFVDKVRETYNWTINT